VVRTERLLLDGKGAPEKWLGARKISFVLQQAREIAQ